MKLNADLKIEDMLREILTSDNAVEAVGRETSAVESAEATAALKAAFADHVNKVKTLCIGCSAEAPLYKCLPCECGGFVCEACQKIEPDDECNHERPSWVPAPEDADAD
jgi:uncharacterized membrane protein